MKDSKSKVFLAGITLLFVILLISGYRIGLRKGVEIGDGFFYRINDAVYKADDNNYLEFETQDGTQSAVIVLNGEEQRAKLRWDGKDAKITFSDGTVINGTWEDGELRDKEGVPVIYSEEYLIASTYEDFKGVRKEALSDALCRASQGEAGTRSSVWLMLFGAVIYVWGAVIIKYPEGTFFFLNRWRYQDAGLSPAGKTVEQIGGAAILMIGAAMLSGVILLV